MKKDKRKFTAEFKDEAVRLALTEGNSISATARDLGLGDSTLHNWVGAYRKRSGSGEAAATPDANHFQLLEENRRLREELRKVQMQRDILKKATAFFANEDK